MSLYIIVLFNCPLPQKHLFGHQSRGGFVKLLPKLGCLGYAYRERRNCLPTDSTQVKTCIQDKTCTWKGDYSRHWYVRKKLGFNRKRFFSYVDSLSYKLYIILILSSQLSLLLTSVFHLTFFWKCCSIRIRYIWIFDNRILIITGIVELLTVFKF